MRDIIESAIEDWSDKTERTAKGTVDGHDVRLEKERYQAAQLEPESWRVAVYVGGNSGISDEALKNLKPDRAQKKFEELVEKHNLVEQ